MDRGTLLDAVPRELLGCDVYEVDGTPEDVREDLDLLAGGERLRPVEDVTVADVAVLGEHKRGVARLWPDVSSNVVSPGWVPTRMGGRDAPG